MASSRTPGARIPSARPSDQSLASQFHNMDLERRSLRTPVTPVRLTEMSLPETLHELGRLMAQVEHKDAQIKQLELEKETLDHANQAMHDEMHQTKAKLRKVEAEKARLIEEINHLNEEKCESEVSLAKLKEQISKLQKTVKVQSDQIAQPNLNGKSRTTPQHPPFPGAFNHVYGQPPPAFNVPQHTLPTIYPPQMPRQSSAVMSTFSTSMSRQQSSAGPSPTSAPMSRQPTNPYQPNSNPSNTPFGGNQVALTNGEDPLTIRLLPEYTPFFNLVEAWARNYANVPDKARDQAMPSGLIHFFRQYTNPDIVGKLMSSGSTRFFAVSKVMNQMIVSFAFRPIMIKGFTLFYDNKIADFRAQLQQVAIPLHLRRACLVASAQTVNEMSKTNGFKPFMEGVISRQVHDMWMFLEPLLAPVVAPNEAWEDLRHIWREAARIGVLMMSKASAFTFDFPPTGSNSHFNPSNMVSRDVNFKQDPQSLGHMAVTVRLSVTPIVTETDFLGNELVPKTLHYSNVLLEF